MFCGRPILTVSLLLGVLMLSESLFAVPKALAQRSNSYEPPTKPVNGSPVVRSPKVTSPQVFTPRVTSPSVQHAPILSPQVTAPSIPPPDIPPPNVVSPTVKQPVINSPPSIGVPQNRSLRPTGILIALDSDNQVEPEAVSTVSVAATAQEFVSRGRFAQQLVKALGYNTDMVSEFAVFRDVPLSHPDYNAVESLRERGFIQGSPEGFYHPDDNIRRLDAYLTVANAFKGIMMTSEQATAILKHFEDAGTLKEEERAPLARLVQQDIIQVHNRWAGDTAPNRLQLQEPLDKETLSHLVEKVRLKTSQATTLASHSNDSTLPILPADLSLSITPTQPIFKEKIAAGDTYFFLSTEDLIVPPSIISQFRPDKTILEDNVLLPKGTRFRGRIVEKVGENVWTLRLNQAQTPNNYFYRMKALMPIAFKGIEETAFITPGEILQVKTMPFASGNKLPAEAEDASTAPSSPPGPATP